MWCVVSDKKFDADKFLGLMKCFFIFAFVKRP